MRIGELSRRSGVSVPTIKFYLREGLLPSGERTSPNQAHYGEPHLQRLKLVRAMLDVGKLSVTAAREVLTAIDSPGSTLHDMLGVAQSAIAARVAAADDDNWKAAEELVTTLVAKKEWQVKPSNSAWQAVIHIMATWSDLGQDDLCDLLDDYADAAEQLAAAELALIGRRSSVDSQVEGAVLGTVLGDPLMAAMRQLAREHASYRSMTGQFAVAALPDQAHMPQGSAD